MLTKEGFEAFYADDRHCHIRHVGTNTVTVLQANPHRPLTAAEVKRRNELAAYLDRCSEDELIEEILLPLFRQLGFHRITASGHKDKSLEYGKDIWMRYTLPTQHLLYFGIQAKKGKIDASGVTKASNANVAAPFTALAADDPHRVAGRLVVRRVRDQNHLDALAVDSANATPAVGVYEWCGFRVADEWHAYLRPA